MEILSHYPTPVTLPTFSLSLSYVDLTVLVFNFFTSLRKSCILLHKQNRQYK